MRNALRFPRGLAALATLTLYLTCYVPAGLAIAGLIRFVLDR